MNVDQIGTVHDTFHAYSPSFTKGNHEDIRINVDIFGGDKFSHVSAVLISHCWQVLFPDLSKHELLLMYGVTDNDFMLIHNPFADYKLEPGIFPVEREFVTRHDEGEFTIHTMGNVLVT